MMKWNKDYMKNEEGMFLIHEFFSALNGTRPIIRLRNILLHKRQNNYSRTTITTGNKSSVM